MSTAATVIIAAADQAAAQADLPGYFTTGYYLDVEGADPTVVTHYVDSGWWYDSNMDMIVNTVTWPRTVRFGMDAGAVLDEMNLKQISSFGENQST